MKNRIYLLAIFLLFSCSTQLKLGKYKSICNLADAPNTILILKNNNKYMLLYPNSVEKLLGEWKIKSDTLILKSSHKSTLKEGDSLIPFNDETRFIIKKNKLINPQNEKCFLIR